MDYPITNSTIKLLKFICRHENCTFAQIKSAFPNMDFMELVNLSLTDYLLCTRQGKVPTQFRDGNFIIADADRFWASPKAEQLLQERRRSWLQWVIPNVISGIALILSIITLLLSQMPQVTEVRILP